MKLTNLSKRQTDNENSNSCNNVHLRRYLTKRNVTSLFIFLSWLPFILLPFTAYIGAFYIDEFFLDTNYFYIFNDIFDKVWSIELAVLPILGLVSSIISFVLDRRSKSTLINLVIYLISIAIVIYMLLHHGI
jgi:hypothetical protein